MSQIAAFVLAMCACHFSAQAPVPAVAVDRAPMWFLADTRPSPGRMSHVTPVYERDGCWLDADDDYARRGVVYSTALATLATVKPGDVLIVAQPNEWSIAVVDAVDPRAEAFTIESRHERPIALAAARTVVEAKEVERVSCHR